MNTRLFRTLVCLLLAAPGLVAAVPDHAETPPPQETQAEGEAHEASDAGDAHNPHAGHGTHGTHPAPAADDEAAVPAVRWASDAPLREGMRRVRAATGALSHAAHGHLDPAQVQAVATELEAAVTDMFSRCKLAPEPDAALHPLLARVLQASAALADGGFDAAALAELESVLSRYPQLFEDAGWALDHDTSH